MSSNTDYICSAKLLSSLARPGTNSPRFTGWAQAISSTPRVPAHAHSVEVQEWVEACLCLVYLSPALTIRLLGPHQAWKVSHERLLGFLIGIGLNQRWKALTSYSIFLTLYSCTLTPPINFLLRITQYISPLFFAGSNIWRGAINSPQPVTRASTEWWRAVC